MGEVYRARDTTLDRDVAIKVLPAATTADPRSRERLRLEAMAAAALDHPFICKIFEVGEHDRAVYLVMEYVPGETLHSRLQRDPMPLAEALRVAGEIADALETAHQRGIIHRDLKPANVMLTPQGHVKLMDFGLARRVSEPSRPDAVTIETAPQLTAPGTVIGTPDYMSPEQAKGLPLDARSDLFSFGVILAEMTGGHHPFRKPSTAETISAVLREPPEFGHHCSPGVRRLLDRLLAKSAEGRPASVADVRAELAGLAAASPASASRGPAAAQPRWKHPAWIALAAVLAAAALYAAVTVIRPARPSGAAPAEAGAPAIRSIAVLPLDNYSGDPGQDYFAEGMTEELTAQLATISQLRVISRGSVMQFKGKARPPMPEIARRLDVDAVVEGSVRRAGDRVRITAQLIDARADRHLWAKSFERSSADVLALQGELASAIAGEINVRLTPAQQERLAASRPVDPGAYDHYLRGRYFFNRPSDENLKKAIAEFESAVGRSPDFAPAYSGLSDAYLWAGYNEGFITAAAAKPKAREAAERAISLDPDSAEAYASLATFKLFYERDWAGCERDFRKSISLNPNYAFARDQFGMALAFQGRFDEAAAEGRRAAELDPLNPQILIDAAMAPMFQGDAAAAKDLARRAAELDPTYFFPPMIIGWADMEDGKFREAIPALKQAQSMGAPPFVTAYLAYAYGRAGDRARALGELDELRRMAAPGEVLPFNLAMVHLGLGDHARTMDELERAHAADSQMLAWLGEDRLFDPLRSEPRFAALLQKLGFK
jgi:serine/threonine-protein kinase